MKKQTKKPAELIYSKIKEGELNVKFTIEKDIGRVFFKDIPLPTIPLKDLDYIFQHLKEYKFIEKHTKKIETGIPIYKCLKVWTSQDRPKMNL